MVKLRGQLKSSALYTIALAATMAVPMLTLPIFTRVLSKEDFGILALSEIYAVFVAGIAFLGSNIAFDRNYFAYESDRAKVGQLTYSILLFVFCNFTLLLVATLLWGDKFSFWIFRLHGKSDILALDLCGTFFALVFELFMSFYRNRREPGLYLKLTLINGLLYLVLTLLFLLGFRWSVQGILLAKFIAFAVMTVGIGIAVLGLVDVALAALALWMLRTGYKIRQ